MNNGKINGSNHFAVTFDLDKAFDKIEWNYLESVMLVMKFPLSIVSIATRCICSITFSILIIGSP